MQKLDKQIGQYIQFMLFLLQIIIYNDINIIFIIWLVFNR